MLMPPYQKKQIKQPRINLILLGKPGSGKSTQANFISKKYALPHISGGELLREETKKGTKLGMQIKEIMARGGLVTEELGSTVLTKLIENKLRGLDCSRGFILDGIPRTIESVHDLELLFRKFGSELHLVINLELSDNFLLERLKYRLTCNSCGATFNQVSHPPRVEGFCDFCRGNLGTRLGDSEIKIIRKRIQKYNEVIKPILEYYSRRGILKTVDISSFDPGRSIEETENAVDRYIKNHHKIKR